jgi:hypothetical protein
MLVNGIHYNMQLLQAKSLYNPYNNELVERQRVRVCLESTEAERIRKNRKMNRSGQNVDRFA